MRKVNRTCLRLLLACIGVSCVATLPGCSSGVGEETAPVEVAVSALETATEVKFDLPPSVSVGTLALAANGTINVGDRVNIRTASGARPWMANIGTNATTIGVSAHVGPLASEGAITLRNNATVHGDALTANPVSYLPGSAITGTTNEHAVFTPVQRLSWTVKYPDASLGDKMLEPGQTASAVPGRYGQFNVKSRAQLQLTAGVYYLDSMILEPDATIKLNQSGGAVVIYVRQTLIYRGSFTTVGGESPNPLVVYTGSSATYIERAFTGNIVAPKARLVLGASGSQHTGTFLAKDLEIYPDVTIVQRPLTIDTDGDGLGFSDEVTTYGTNPMSDDTDADGIKDGPEVTYWGSRTDGVSWNSDLENFESKVRATGDGQKNVVDSDSDDDGIPDGAELAGWDITVEGVTRHVTSDPAKFDTDGDGLSDGVERNGWQLALLDQRRQVQSDPSAIDTDGDTLSDWVERDERSDPRMRHSFSPNYEDTGRLSRRAALDTKTGIESPVVEFGTPEKVSMTSFSETFASTGNFSYEIHIFQPDSNGEAINIELKATDGDGAVDYAHGFSNIRITERPNETGAVTTAIPDGTGQVIGGLTTSKSGWYLLQFNYNFPNPGRTFSYRAYDAGGQPLETYWNDPPTDIAVKAQLRVKQATNVYFKGGAYRNTSPTEYAYVDNVALDGHALYRRGFDQGKYDFPIGYLNAGDYTLEFNFKSSGGYPTKLWYGVSEYSFDRQNNKTSWDPAQILYMGNLHTRDYDAWSEGVASAQGATAGAGVRPPPLRRGGRFMLALTDTTLAAGTAQIRVYRYSTLTQVNWPQAMVSDDAGGIYVNGAFSARHREHWTLDVPADAPIGRYIVRAYKPDGTTRIGSDIMVYVIHDPYRLVDGTKLTKQQLETFGYDEEEDGRVWQTGYGPDADNERDQYGAYFYPSSNQTTYTLGSFVRTSTDPQAISVLDLAVAAADGTSNEFESMLRLHRLVNQRMIWQSPTRSHDVDEILTRHGGSGLTISDAEIYSQSGQALPAAKVISGQCLDFGNALTGMARSIGVVARPSTSQNWSLFGWNFHVFTEAFMPDALLPLQQGSDSSTSNSNRDTDNWALFDATDWGTNFANAEEAVSPRLGYGRSSTVAGNNTGPIVTTSLTWDPTHVGSGGLIDPVDSFYYGTDFWANTASVTGWLSRGDRDVFRRIVPAGGPFTATAVSLTGNGLAPAVCATLTSELPLDLTDCTSATSSKTLTAGDWTIVVQDRGSSDPGRQGNQIQYRLSFN